MAVAAMVLAPALAGCGGAEPQRAANPLVGPLATPAVTDADRAEIAAVINEVRVAFADGEGEYVCERLTERGVAEMTSQDVVPFIEDEVDARIEGEPLEPTCEAAVASFTEGLTSSQRRQLAGVLSYRPGDVDPGAADEDHSAAVRVTCLESPGKAWFAAPEDGTWKLELPFCSGR
ncbi:MAG: hypothetical protein M9964_13875 [Solirubrobacterales bacterium]|nr:hypothetical protein [Solirubrobacterales bacterium]